MQTSVKAGAPLAAAAPPAPEATDYGDVSPFPPAWVKTAADFEAWDRAETQKALDDPRPPVPHDVVMARLDELLGRLRLEKESRDAILALPFSLVWAIL